jgi:hypothetical protein
MTTVGYGDEFRTTARGRVLGVAAMRVGIGFLIVLTGAVAERVLTIPDRGVAEGGRRGSGAGRSGPAGRLTRRELLGPSPRRAEP